MRSMWRLKRCHPECASGSTSIHQRDENGWRGIARIVDFAIAEDNLHARPEGMTRK